MNLKRIFSATAAAILVASVVHPTSASAAAGPNLIPNPDLELATPAWSPTGWGTNNAVFSTTDGELSGSKAATVTISNYANGAAEWVSPTFPVAAGQYTFQDSYKSNVYTEVGGTLTFTDGSSQYLYITTLGPTPTQDTTSTLPTDANVWKRSDISITLPANAKSLQVFHILTGAGFLSSDAYAFFTGTTAPPVVPPGTNLVANPGMELQSGGVPTGWSQAGWGTSTRKFTVVTGSAHGGTKSVRVDVSNWVDGDGKWVYDSVPITGDGYYKYSDWYKSSADSSVSLGYEMADGSTSWANLFLGIPASTTWKQFSSGITAPKGAVKAYFAHFLPRNGFLQIDDVSMTQAANPPGFNRAIVTLGYDDGSASIYNNALPLLDSYGFKSTQFVPSGDIGDYVWTKAQIKNVYNRGHEIGGHSVTHPMLSTLTPTQLKKELVNNKNTLEAAIGKTGTVKSFASPYGDYSSAVIAAIFAAGFTNHRSVDVGFNTKGDFTVTDLHVQNVKITTTLEEFEGWVDYAIQNHYYLDLVYHEVTDVPDLSDPDGDAYRVTVETHAAMLKYLHDKGVAVETQGQAVAELIPQMPK